MRSLALAIALALSACRDPGVRQCLDLEGKKEYESAIEVCEQAFAATGDPRVGAAAARAHSDLGHDEEVLAWAERLIGSPEEALAWGLVARVHLIRGDLARATDGYRKSVDLARAAGDHAQAARGLYGLFYLAWMRTDYRPALLSAQGSAEEAEKAGDQDAEGKAQRALANVYYDLGDLAAAERALEAARKLNNPKGAPNLLALLGLILLDQERPALARATIEEALGKAGGEGRTFFRSVHLNLVRAALDLGESARAERHLAAAWEHAEPDGQSQTALLFYQARLEHERGDFASAATTITKALDQEPIADWAWQLEHLRGLVEVEQGDAGAAREAFKASVAVVEDLRGSLGFDELKAWLLDKKRRPFEALFRLEAQAGRSRAALDVVERTKARAFLDAFIRSTENTANALPEVSADRVETLSTLLPAMSESPVVTTRPLDEVLHTLRDRHVLIYFETEGELWLITLAERRLALRRLAAVDTVEKRVSRFLADPDDPDEAASLGALLLPADLLPAPGGRLYLVTDSVLGRLPFAALRPTGRYLVEDHEISYVPSLNALVALESRHRPPTGPSLVIADPRGDLPAAGREAGEVARKLGASARSGSEATLEALVTASRARVLHLATHTGLGRRGPWLALADGDIDAATILSRGLGPRLVVLASCASAARLGRGMWGSLGAAFLVAGSDGVLAALWSIEDEPARRFVLRFYDEGGAAEAAAALARAQRFFIASGEPPAVWAPFVFFGSDRRAML